MKDLVEFKKLLIGIGSPLLIGASMDNHGYRTSLIGYKTSEFIVFEAPKAAGLESRLQEGNTFFGAFLSSGTVVRFKSVVLCHVAKPVRLIVASFPHSLEHLELRKSQRVVCNIPATLSLHDDAMEYDGVIIDISSGGCRYTANAISGSKTHLLHPGGKADLTFELLGVQGKRTFSGQIVNVNQDGKHITIGIRYRIVEKKIIENINQYIESVAKALS